jgi:hypothetical protein
MLMDHREVQCEGVHWIYLARNRDQCQALVNMVMNIQVPQSTVNLVSGRTAQFLMDYAPCS